MLQCYRILFCKCEYLGCNFLFPCQCARGLNWLELVSLLRESWASVICLCMVKHMWQCIWHHIWHHTWHRYVWLLLCLIGNLGHHLHILLLLATKYWAIAFPMSFPASWACGRRFLFSKIFILLTRILLLLFRLSTVDSSVSYFTTVITSTFYFL